MPQLIENEVSLLTKLSRFSGILSQRELARRTGISTGLLNLTLRNLIRRGYVKARALNKKKLQYLLTPKGALHIMNRSHEIIVTTLRQYRQLEVDITSTLHAFLQKGHRYFFIYGEGELCDIVKLVFWKNFIDTAVIIDSINNVGEDTLILNLTGSRLGSRTLKLSSTEAKVVNLVDYLHIKKGDNQYA